MHLATQDAHLLNLSVYSSVPLSVCLRKREKDRERKRETERENERERQTYRQSDILINYFNWLINYLYILIG
jgi:hypothetical protein